MTYYVYILFSDKIRRYYIGYTENIDYRLQQHNEGRYQNSYTTLTKDWRKIFFIECETKKQAILIEKHVKNMKSKKYIDNLVRYPEISDKLKKQYC